MVGARIYFNIMQQPWHYFYYYFSSNGSQRLTIYASPRFCWLGHKTSVQVVSPVCISVCKSHDIMLRQQKKFNTFSTLYFAERNWKKMRTSITMNVFCTAASSKYWRMKIDLDFIWLLHTIFGKLLMQLSGNHVSPRKRHSQDFHYLST